jgi:hypothetical protein
VAPDGRGEPEPGSPDGAAARVVAREGVREVELDAEPVRQGADGAGRPAVVERAPHRVGSPVRGVVERGVGDPAVAGPAVAEPALDGAHRRAGEPGEQERAGPPVPRAPRLGDEALHRAERDVGDVGHGQTWTRPWSAAVTGG